MVAGFATRRVAASGKRVSVVNGCLPNEKGKPWSPADPGYRPPRSTSATRSNGADVKPVTWKMFRHSLNTHGKQWFGPNKEQM